MKFLQFLGSYAVYLFAFLLLLAVWGIMAALIGVTAVFILATVLSAVACAVIFLAFKYIIHCRHIARIERLKHEMDEVYLIGEMLPRPINGIEDAYFSVMKEVSYSAVSRIEEMSRESDEYLEYVESWVHEI